MESNLGQRQPAAGARVFDALPDATARRAFVRGGGRVSY